MRDLKSDLLGHLRNGRRLPSFPGLQRVTSLDEIKDGAALVTVPDNLTVYLLTDIRVTSRRPQTITLDCSREAYSLRYNVTDGCLVFHPIEMQSSSGIGIISEEYTRPNKAYIALR